MFVIVRQKLAKLPRLDVALGIHLPLLPRVLGLQVCPHQAQLYVQTRGEDLEMERTLVTFHVNQERMGREPELTCMELT